MGFRVCDALKTSTIDKFNTCYYCNIDVRRGVGFDKPQLGSVGPTCDCVPMTSFGHSGFTGTFAWADPENELVYVFMSNRTYPDAENFKLVREDMARQLATNQIDIAIDIALPLKTPIKQLLLLALFSLIINAQADQTYQILDVPNDNYFNSVKVIEFSKNLKIRGFQLSRGVYLGQTRIVGEYGFGIVVGRKSYSWGISTRGLSILKHF